MARSMYSSFPDRSPRVAAQCRAQAPPCPPPSPIPRRCMRAPRKSQKKRTEEITRPAWYRCLSHALRGIVTFAVSFLTSGVVSLSLRSAPRGIGAWRSSVPPGAASVHGGLLLCLAQYSWQCSVLPGAALGMLGWSSVPLGAAYTAVFHSVWCGLRYKWFHSTR